MRARTSLHDLVYPERRDSDVGAQTPGQVTLDDWSWFTGPSIYRTPIWYRCAEIAASLVALTLALPVILVVAILIKLESRGPAIFVQRRMTTGCRPFKFIKLRTMYTDCDQRFPELAPKQLQHQESSQIRLQIPDDPRVTPLGRWLRRTSIDELPNFWNVLTGDMALVGPRPEITEMLPHYKGAMLEKFSVRPGITGYAQILGRGELDFVQTVGHDLRYVQDRSLRVDLGILRDTIKSVFLCRGAF